jgi:sigma-B regulation protein RsbU (phosphoserine phosphatase)
VTFEDARILVVEDEPGVLRAVQRILASHHEVTPAQRVAEALEHVERERAQRRSFDIAIVDLQLPDGDGYQLNREIHELSPDTDVILMTGSTTHQDRKLFQALEEDAFYFLFKPFDRRVLLALVDRCLRLRDLRRKNDEHLARLARDQEKAREIQRSLLPETPLEVHGWYLTARFEPADEVSGDLYAVLPLGDAGGGRNDGLAVLVADVVGHGLPAAMYAGMLRSTVDAARRLDPDPAVVFELLFQGLDFFASNRGASLFYGVLGADGRLRYLNAGHPSGLLRRDGGELEYLESTGPKLLPSPLVRELPRSTGEVELAPGDRLLLYTDGLTEAKDPANHELGLPVVESVFAGGDSTAEEAMESVLTTFERHCDGRPVEDDVTVLLVERVG